MGTFSFVEDFGIGCFGSCKNFGNFGSFVGNFGSWIGIECCSVGFLDCIHFHIGSSIGCNCHCIVGKHFLGKF